MAPGSLRNAKLVCSRIPVSCRRDSLTWSHHCEIGMMFKEPVEIERWLNLAEKAKYSRSELRKRIRAALVQARVGSAPVAGSPASRPFALLRELKALGRFVNNHADVWANWTPEACSAALAELEPITAFIAEMNLRKRSNRNRSS